MLTDAQADWPLEDGPTSMLLLDILAEEEGEKARLTAGEDDQALTASSSDRPSKRPRPLPSQELEVIRKLGGVYRARRSNGRYFTHMVLPKILKSDIRRSIPQMYCNMQNSDDSQLMAGFLQTFCANNFKFRHSVTGLGVNTRASLAGVENTLGFWQRTSDLMPDRAYRVVAAQVTARSDGTGVVSCEMEVRATMLFGPSNPFIPRGFMNEDCRKYQTEALRLLASMGAPAEGLVQTRIHTRGRVVFQVDASNRILHMAAEIGPQC